jgi:uncharacterized protein (TIGR03000 family)
MYSVVLVVALAGSAEAPDCHRNSCHGGGGCYGGGYVSTGCWGGGGGCWGGGGCFGGHRHGGCFGGGCTGGYGGCYGGGCYGGGYYGGCTGGCYGGYGGYPYMGGPKTMPGAEKLDNPKEKGKTEEVNVPTPGTIVVNLPSNAKLTIDGYVSKQTTSQRRLVTVPINPGQEFTYTLVAEVNGTQQTQVVTVRAGEELPVTFNFTTSVPVSAGR